MEIRNIIIVHFIYSTISIVYNVSTINLHVTTIVDVDIYRQDSKVFIDLTKEIKMIEEERCTCKSGWHNSKYRWL